MKALARILLFAVLLLAAGTPVVALAQREKGDPRELWEAFPLEPSPAPTEAPERRTPVQVVDSGDDGLSTFSTIALMVLAAGVGAMAVSLARGRARARAQHAAAAPEAARPSTPPSSRVESPTAPPTRTTSNRFGRESAASEPVAPKQAPVVEPPAPGRGSTNRGARKPPRKKKAASNRAAAPPAPIRPLTAEDAAAKPAPPPKAHSKHRATTKPASRESPPVPRAPGRPRANAPGRQSCRIRLRRSYRGEHFYAESATGECIAESPRFKDAGQAAGAFEALLHELQQDGWEIASRRPGTWEVVLERRAGVPRQPVE